MTADAAGIVESSTQVSHRLRPASVMRVLCFGVAALVILGIAADLYLVFHSGETTRRVLTAFSLASDSSIPTYAASLLLLCCALLLAVAAAVERKTGPAVMRGWALLSAIFLLLSLDEVAMLHERSGQALKALVPAVETLGGAFHYSWTLIGIPAVILLAAILWRWFVKLDPPMRGRSALAAALYLSGAIGVELVNSALDAATDGRSIAISLLTALEESLEFAGVLVFLRALMLHLCRRGASLKLGFAPA